MPSKKKESDNVTIDPSKFDTYRKLIKSHPLFSTLPETKLIDLVRLMTEARYHKGDKIVVEGDFVDCIYFIVEGNAEITKRNNTDTDVLVASLKENDSIGLSSTGFFSENGKRTATVTAINEILLLRLDIINFNEFLREHPAFNKSLVDLTNLMLRIDFIKQLYPFTQLTNEEIHSIALQIKEINLPAYSIIFNKDDPATCCYLLQSGNVEIFISDHGKADHKLAVLESPQLFGEAALLTTQKRNASARTLNDCKLLVLENELLISLLKKSRVFAHSLMAFMVNRFRPMRNENVITHHRSSKSERKLITLHNTHLDKYYDLSEEGWYIWEQLDGIQTIQDLTIFFYKKYGAFVPDVICNLLYNLEEAGFVVIPTVNPVHPNSEPATVSKFQQLRNSLKKIMEFELVFTQTDKWLTKIYNAGIWVFYTKPLQFVLLTIIIAGLIIFVNSFHEISLQAKLSTPNFWLFLLILIPVSIIAVFFHEAGHAFTAKHLGYKIHRMGMGWISFMPIAFTDTSPLWLAKQHEQLKVNIAGIYVDLLIASCLALSLLFITSSQAIYIWLLSLFIYLNAFKNLSMVKEYDGYFLLVNVLDYPGLRRAAIFWYNYNLKNTLKQPELIKKYKAEIYYWLLCGIYLLASSFFVFLLLKILFQFFSVDYVFGIPTIFISILFAVLTVLFSIISVHADIKRVREI